MSVCKIENVEKVYYSAGGEVPALRGVSCEIDKGDLVVLAGPSGSGKTTLANIIGFLDTLSKGTYHFNDKDVSTFSEHERTLLRREHVGFIFQSFNLISILTVQENVSMESELKGEGATSASKKALEVLEMVGMADYASRFPNELSGGQQQRVSIARALIKNPTLLIADEPTASLDSQNTMDIIELLVDLNKQSHSVCVVCTHDERVIKVAPRLFHIEDGHLNELTERQKHGVIL